MGNENSLGSSPEERDARLSLYHDKLNKKKLRRRQLRSIPTNKFKTNRTLGRGWIHHLSLLCEDDFSL